MSEHKETVLYHCKKDVNDYRDMIDLFCKFSEKLELTVNEPSYEFMMRRLDFLHEEMDELCEATYIHDRVEIVDGAADVAFVAITQIYHMFRTAGFNPVESQTKVRAALIEVGKTNLTKIVPTKKGEKITKPHGWEAPNIADLFLTQKERAKKWEQERVERNDGEGVET